MKTTFLISLLTSVILVSTFASEPGNPNVEKETLHLKTSLAEGPPTEVLTEVFRKAASSDTSWMGAMRGRGMDTEKALKMGILTNEVMSGTISNEYIRTIADEKNFFIEFEAVIQPPWGSQKKISVPLRFIKRGVKWFSSAGE